VHRSMSSACRCGHGHDAHEHFHHGLGCSLCPDGCCPTFRSPWGLQPLEQLFRRSEGHGSLVGAPGPAVAERPHLYLVR